MDKSILGEIMSWLAFVFLIILGLEASLSFSKKIAKIEYENFLVLALRQRLWYPIGLGACLLFAVIILFSTPFSDVWSVMVLVSYLLFLNLAVRKLLSVKSK
jgi:cell division protein FtsW (lipid II flippase)